MLHITGRSWARGCLAPRLFFFIAPRLRRQYLPEETALGLPWLAFIDEDLGCCCFRIPLGLAPKTEIDSNDRFQSTNRAQDARCQDRCLLPSACLVHRVAIDGSVLASRPFKSLEFRCEVTSSSCDNASLPESSLQSGLKAKC